MAEDSMSADRLKDGMQRTAFRVLPPGADDKRVGMVLSLYHGEGFQVTVASLALFTDMRNYANAC